MSDQYFTTSNFAKHLWPFAKNRVWSTAKGKTALVCRIVEMSIAQDKSVVDKKLNACVNDQTNVSTVQLILIDISKGSQRTFFVNKKT